MRLLFLCLALSSCSTTIYDGNGGKLAVIRSDARDVVLTKSFNGEIAFSASVLDNSTPTKAVGSVIKTGIATWGAAKERAAERRKKRICFMGLLLHWWFLTL